MARRSDRSVLCASCHASFREAASLFSWASRVPEPPFCSPACTDCILRSGKAWRPLGFRTASRQASLQDSAPRRRWQHHGSRTRGGVLSRYTKHRLCKSSVLSCVRCSTLSEGCEWAAYAEGGLRHRALHYPLPSLASETKPTFQTELTAQLAQTEVAVSIYTGSRP